MSASLAQIGEFSFILAALGVSLKLLPPEGQSLILAGALISIALNPLAFALAEPAQRWIRARSALARRLERSDDPLAELPQTTDERYLARQVVLVGYGRVGRHVAEALGTYGVPCVVVDQNRERVEELRGKQIPAVFGDAGDPTVLIQAHIAKAKVLVIATPDTIGVRRMMDTARQLNPAVMTVVRSHSEAEARLLERESDAKVLVGERELASAMVKYVVEIALPTRTTRHST